MADKKIKFGVIGLGNRGYSVMKAVLFSYDEIEVVACCDDYQDRCEKASNAVKEKYGKVPFSTTDYKELLKRDDVDAVYISCAWESHSEVAAYALRAKKAVAMEVGGAYSLDELFDLVRAYEETKTPFMFMENCCFDEHELLVTGMARKGVFGEIVHCHGAYGHDLRDEITGGNINRHYRLRNYTSRNCENYPTHELGPIAKILNINRGNRMVSLVSVASKARGLDQYVKDHPELVKKDPSLKDRVFNQGDIVNTIITCANGETISLKLDTTLPRSYSREFTVRGTKGSYFGDMNTVFLDGMKESFDTVSNAKETFNNATQYIDEYQAPVWKYMTKEDRESGHGGMDGIEFRYFIDALLEGKEMPIDVYDAASWMCISALTEISIAQGGLPQAIPDFTHGMWLRREPCDVVLFDGKEKRLH